MLPSANNSWHLHNIRHAHEHNRQYRRALHGSRRSLVADEVREVQSRHQRVLGELNLDVEAMLMPTMADQQNGDREQNVVAINGGGAVAHSNGNATELQMLGHHHHHHVHHEMQSSPIATCAADLDSGFSGSSSASYRSGLGSLRRSLGRTSTPEIMSNGHYVGCNGSMPHHQSHQYYNLRHLPLHSLQQQDQHQLQQLHQQQLQQHHHRINGTVSISSNSSKVKAAMIWKKGWKKLQALGSLKNGKSA
ncbi:hypothetical protein TKK_0013352 [Trichogramma kaykai]